MVVEPSETAPRTIRPQGHEADGGDGGLPEGRYESVAGQGAGKRDGRHHGDRPGKNGFHGPPAASAGAKRLAAGHQG